MIVPFNFRAKCVVVLGGTSGIGRTLALGFAQAGANVVASSRSEASTASMTQEMIALGANSFSHTVDVTSRESIQSSHNEAIPYLGAVHVLGNCAGATERVPTLDSSEDTWKRSFDLNLLGTLRACQIFGRSMVQQVRDASSISLPSRPFVAFHEVAPYGASKAGVGALTKSLAVELAPHGFA